MRKGYVTALACYGSAIFITHQEKTTLSPILGALHYATILVNDYFSWEKELATHQMSDGQFVVTNCVSLHMRLYSMSSDEAKHAVRDKAIGYEQQYCTLKKEFLAERRGNEVSDSVLVYLDITEALHTGNLLWSITCPRYDTSYKGNPYKDCVRKPSHAESVASEQI
jgi:hypothetical protein